MNVLLATASRTLCHELKQALTFDNVAEAGLHNKPKRAPRCAKRVLNTPRGAASACGTRGHVSECEVLAVGREAVEGGEEGWAACCGVPFAVEE